MDSSRCVPPSVYSQVSCFSPPFRLGPRAGGLGGAGRDVPAWAPRSDRDPGFRGSRAQRRDARLGARHRQPAVDRRRRRGGADRRGVRRQARRAARIPLRQSGVGLHRGPRVPFPPDRRHGCGQEPRQPRLPWQVDAVRSDRRRGRPERQPRRLRLRAPAGRQRVDRPGLRPGRRPDVQGRPASEPADLRQRRHQRPDAGRDHDLLPGSRRLSGGAEVQEHRTGHGPHRRLEGRRTLVSSLEEDLDQEAAGRILQQEVEVDYKKILGGKEPDVVLEDGDVLVVKESLF